MNSGKPLWFGAVIGLAGFALLLHADWRVAVGVFLALWGNNVQQSRTT